MRLPDVGRRGLMLVVAALVLGPACGAKPAPVTPPPPPPIPLDTKVAWILRLEQQRLLRDAPAESVAQAPTPPAAAPGPAAAPAATSAGVAPARSPDLLALVNDTDPTVRRRSALAIGRIGDAEGVPALAAALKDADPEVRASAAFALGLLGSGAAVPPLQAALQDLELSVRSRAVEGLGLIGDKASAPSIADAAANCHEPLAAAQPDDEAAPTPEAEFCRLALVALVRTGQYDQLARVALDAQGAPVSRWWPVAFALQRIGDKRAAPALLTLASTQSVLTPAFALRGLAAAGDRSAASIARDVATRPSADSRLRIAAIRALGQIGGDTAFPVLLGLARARTSPNIALEAVTAIGALGDARAFDALLDLLTDPWPAMRAAALSSAARVSPEGFLLVASGLPADPDWSVRVALAEAFATLPPDQVRNEIIELTHDSDARVRGPALRALAKVGAPDLSARLFEALDADDFVVRSAAAELVGDTKPAGGVEHLTAAYTRGVGDAAYGARAAALGALAKYGTSEARQVLHRALEDKAWPVRWRAAELLRGLGEAAAAPSRPAPLRQPADYFESAGLLHPSFSPHAYLETKKGTIEIELDLVDAPVTSQSFIDLARLGFFNGLKIHRVVPNFVVQAGDPRGDGEGGPGYALMDELSAKPYVRGTVGMALDWRDTGGSQFFITLSPQPHLDGKYTVFGRVVHGDDVLDQLAQWDVIDRVRIWDGVNLQ